MNYKKFEIIPDYKIKKYFKYSLFLIGFILIIIPTIISDYDVLSFFGLIVIIIGLLLTLFSSKQYLSINQELIKFESKSIVKEFSQSISIRFNDIEKIFFLKRQFMILGARSPIADADEQTLYNENRIVFILKENKSHTIKQVGKLEEFKKAYSIIKSKMDDKKK